MTARERVDALTPAAAAVLGAALLAGVVFAAGWIGPPGFAHPFTSWGGLLHPDGVWPDWNRWPGLALVVFLGAFGVLWCVVFRQARRMRWSTRSVWWIGASWMTPVAVGPPLLSNDVFSYVAQGGVSRAGEDPTRFSAFVLGWSSPLLQAVDPRWRDTPSPYGPLATLIERAAAGERPVVAIMALRLLALLAVAAAGVLVVHLARRADPTSAGAATSALLLTWANPLLVLHVVASVHFEGVLLVLVLAALWCLHRSHPLAPVGAVVCAVAVAAVKLPIGLVVLAAVMIVSAHRVDDRLTRIRTGFGLAVVAVGAWTVLCLAAGSGWNVLAVVSTPSSGRTLTAPATFVADLLTPVRWCGAADGATLDQIGRVSAALGGAAVIVFLLSTLARRSLSTTLGGALLALALGSPVLYPWYLVWSVPLLAVTGGPSRSRRLALLGAVSAVLTVQGLTRGETFAAVGVISAAVIAAVVVTEPVGRPLLERLQRWRRAVRTVGSGVGADV